LVVAGAEARAMAEGGQEAAAEEGRGPACESEGDARWAADPGAEIDERLVEQALAGAWYRDPRGTPETQAAARQAQEALVRGMMAGLGPRDTSEQIWAQQTSAAQLAATDAFKWLAEPELPASARVQALRLAAQLMTVTGRQLASLDLHRARRRAEAEAERRAEERVRQAAEARAWDAAAAEAQPRCGIVIEPLEEDPVAMARRWAQEVKANERRLRAGLPLEAPRAEPAGARPADGAPDLQGARDAAPAAELRPARRAARRPAQGRQAGVLVVPEKPSPEDWTRSLREYYRVLEEPP
jgi:hypothetical protein